jgi:hypothetical protein
MFWLKSRQRPLRAQKPKSRPRTRLSLEALEDRCVPTVFDVVGPINAVEGPNNNLQVATVTDTDLSVTANQLIVTVNYGDGTTAVTNNPTPPTGTTFDPNLGVSGSAGKFIITDNHTFLEESGSTVPPFSFTASVTASDPTSTFTRLNVQAFVTDASITDGDPVPIGPGTQFFGGDQGDSTSAAAAEANFEAAIGGSKNTAAVPQNGGFRVINWDGVKVDGTDKVAGPNSTTVITPGHTVGIPLDRFQGSGVIFGAVYAVSNDGFQDVNPNVGPGAGDPKGLFPAFSAPNTFAMFNDNGIDFTFVDPSSPTTGPVSAASRGFGAIFLNVQQPGTTIQYFHGNTLIDTLNVPTSTPGAAVFAGELFDSPEVTNVLLTLGKGVIFKFDGTTVTPGGGNSGTNNLVAVDDWVFPEPVPIVNGTNIPVSAPIGVAPGTLNAAVLVHATAGQSFTGVAANFSDADPNASAKDFTATINWGDGHSSNGTIVADGKGGFAVIGTNTYASAGAFPIAVQIQDFGGSFFTVTNTANVAVPIPSPPPPVTTGNLNFTETPQGFFGLSGLLVQPLASNNQPVGPALDVPFFLSTFLTLDIAHISSLDRDASGNVVIDISLAGITLDLNYNGAGQLTGASVFGISIPTFLI